MLNEEAVETTMGTLESLGTIAYQSEAHTSVAEVEVPAASVADMPSMVTLDAGWFPFRPTATTTTLPDAGVPIFTPENVAAVPPA
jgi:hypothetical protein